MQSIDADAGEPSLKQGLLDPADWSAFDKAAARALAAATAKMKHASEGRTWTPTPEPLKRALQIAPPVSGLSADELVDRLVEILPYGVGNTHPRFFGWVHGSGAPGNLLSDMIAAAMNANCGGRDHVGIYIERQVVDWCRTLMGFPEAASGLIVSGTSMASLIAAKTARDAALSFANRKAGNGSTQLVGYTSQEAHNCLARAFDFIGLGEAALRRVPVTSDFEIDLEALAEQVSADRAGGYQPFFLAGTAGTVNTGAIDDLDGLATFAHNEGLWFHVDGAFGASAILSPDHSPALKGIERADSLAFDFHKWMHVNYDAGCVLIRDGDLHKRAFANRPDYLAAGREGLAGGEPWPVDFGPELSRGFRALKVWAHLLEHGTEKIGAAIEENCRQARYLASTIDAHPAFERLAPTSLNICCFRYTRAGASLEQLNQLNTRLVERIQLEGIAAPSTTKIDGQVCIRVNLTNHRTKMSDIDVLVQSLADLGAAESASAR